MTGQGPSWQEGPDSPSHCRHACPGAQHEAPQDVGWDAGHPHSEPRHAPSRQQTSPHSCGKSPGQTQAPPAHEVPGAQQSVPHEFAYRERPQ
jgi:hypothetical protein